MQRTSNNSESYLSLVRLMSNLYLLDLPFDDFMGLAELKEAEELLSVWLDVYWPTPIEQVYEEYVESL